MGKSQETFRKKELQKRKEKKRKEKEEKKLARKENEKESGKNNMIAYVDENGVITSVPPDPQKKKRIKPEDIEISIPKSDSKYHNNPIRVGKVTFFDESKGYGFIIDSETQEKVFVHINNTLEEIHQDNVVNFEIEKGPKGPNATNVKLSIVE